MMITLYVSILSLQILLNLIIVLWRSFSWDSIYLSKSTILASNCIGFSISSLVGSLFSCLASYYPIYNSTFNGLNFNRIAYNFFMGLRYIHKIYMLKPIRLDKAILLTKIKTEPYLCKAQKIFEESLIWVGPQRISIFMD